MLKRQSTENRRAKVDRAIKPTRKTERFFGEYMSTLESDPYIERSLRRER